MNSFVDDVKVLEIVEDGNKYISSVDEYVLMLQNSLDVVRELCLKVQAFLPYINSSITLNLDNVWNVDENRQILQDVDLLEREVDNLREYLLQLFNLNSDIENIFDQIQQYRNDIETVFANEGSGLLVQNNENSEPIIKKADVMGAIENSFSNNRDLTNNFSNEVYRQIYNDVIKEKSGGDNLL